MRRFGLALGAALASVLAAAWLRRFTRIAVGGHSMEPTLLDGDWLLVDRRARRMQRGDVVVARDPRAPQRLIVKRVVEVAPDGGLVLAGDHGAHRDERIGPLERDQLLGSVRLRYWPPRRIGRVARRLTDSFTWR